MDIVLIVNEYLKDKQDLIDHENDSINIVDNQIVSWNFKNIPCPIIQHGEIPGVAAIPAIASIPAVPAKPAEFDAHGVEISPFIPATAEIPGTPEIPAISVIPARIELVNCNFTLESLQASLNQEVVNAEALKYLADTDYLIIRELDAGTPCPTEIKQLRAEARLKIVR